MQTATWIKIDIAVDGLQKEVTAQKNEYTTLKRNLPNIVVSETRPENPTEGMILFRIIKGPEIPIPVTDYFFRFDASKLYLDDGAKVAQWDDLSVNGNDLIQPNTVSQPTFLKTGLNGKPTVRFNNSFMDISPFSFDKYDLLYIYYFPILVTKFICSCPFAIFTPEKNGLHNSLNIGCW